MEYTVGRNCADDRTFIVAVRCANFRTHLAEDSFAEGRVRNPYPDKVWCRYEVPGGIDDQVHSRRCSRLDHRCGHPQVSQVSQPTAPTEACCATGSRARAIRSRTRCSAVSVRQPAAFFPSPGRRAPRPRVAHPRCSAAIPLATRRVPVRGRRLAVGFWPVAQ